MRRCASFLKLPMYPILSYTKFMSNFLFLLNRRSKYACKVYNWLLSGFPRLFYRQLYYTVSGGLLFAIRVK